MTLHPLPSSLFRIRRNDSRDGGNADNAHRNHRLMEEPAQDAHADNAQRPLGTMCHEEETAHDAHKSFKTTADE